MKTLHTIQTLSKIGKVFSKIVSICCIVGFCGCAVGMIAMLVGAETIQLGGITLQGILETEAGISVGTIWAATVVGMILCIGEFFVSRMAYRYFDNELKAGTPFTVEGAKELLHLGISTIWIPLVSMILAQVVQGTFSQLMKDVEKLSLEDFDSVAMGVVFLIVSLLCRYGAELKDKSEN